MNSSREEKDPRAPSGAPSKSVKANSSYTVASLFTGIAGIERGLELAGLTTEFMCESYVAAQAVLKKHFPDIPIATDVEAVKSLPKADLVTAGFPCNDLSSVGPAIGIQGFNSGLVNEVFRLINQRKKSPTWLLLENVPFMLQLHRGKAIRHIVKWLDGAGFFWAYRIVDTRAFGLPQRRRRVILLASRTEDPREVLLSDDVGGLLVGRKRRVARGFYWTEGNRGVGWAVNAIPTLKGGSSIGIPSPPAIWFPDGAIITPDIRDAERLQGLPIDWTLPATQSRNTKNSFRWKLVGNAVSVPVAKWIGRRLIAPKTYIESEDKYLGWISRVKTWPHAAWGRNGKVYEANVSAWPVSFKYKHLDEFLKFQGSPLREGAASGFLSRARASTLRFEEGFLDALERHLDRIRRETA